jgi:membrane-associated protease RseP (regulator of RpoE activity)
VESPAAAAGIRAGDRIVAVEGTEDPTHLELVCTTRTHVGEPVTLTVLRGERLLDAELIPVLGEVPKVYWDDCPGLRPVEGQVGLIGVTLAEARERGGLVSAITGGATLVWDSLVDSVQNLGRIFGPDGIGRLFALLFTDAPREITDPASLVGIGQAAGQTASGGNAGDLLFLIGFLNVLIGFLNLLPLPPFDGGHLAVLAIERVRGRAVDMRKVIPVAVTVAAFFIVLTVSFIYLDIVKPLPLGP